MKKYKNISLSLGLYILALLITYVIPRFIWSYSPLPPRSVGYSLIGISIALVVLGMFFGFRSINEKESTWAGHLTILIGGLVLFSPLILFYIGARL
jgi:hypothetical protein